MSVQTVDWRKATQLVLEGQTRADYVTFALTKLAEIVCNKYYYFCTRETRLDLVQEGILKGFLLIDDGYFRPNGNLKNYLFTGMRNSMQNFLYSSHRETPVLEFFDETTRDENWEVLSVKYREVLSVFKRFESAYRAYIKPVMQKMSEMGFQFEEVPEELYYDPLPAKINNDVRERLVCLVICAKVDGVF